MNNLTKDQIEDKYIELAFDPRRLLNWFTTNTTYTYQRSNDLSLIVVYTPSLVVIMHEGLTIIKRQTDDN